MGWPEVFSGRPEERVLLIMKIRRMTPRTALSLLALLALLAGCGRDEAPDETAISGHIEQGLRVLPIDPVGQDQVLRIYRAITSGRNWWTAPISAL